MNIPNIIDKYITNKAYNTDQIGKSNAGVYLFDDFVLKVQPISTESANELQMLQWLNGKISVPKIIEHIGEHGYSYLLMSKCTGKMSCAEQYMTNPIKQVDHLAEALYQLWSIDTEDCPCHWPLEKCLRQAEENVAAGGVDMDNAQPDTFGPNGFRSPEELLNWLTEHKPEEAAVISHGDFCLPNIFLNEHGPAGFVDLGKAGVADKWRDIALCYRSLANNYTGIYNGNKYPGFHDEILFNALEIEPDWERIRYYILLDELF